MSSHPAPPITLIPEVLYEASPERIEAAEDMRKSNYWAISMYLSGLSVECILQAHAMRAGSAHDAHHDLDAWLSRCSIRLQDTIRDLAGESWGRVRIIWTNKIRYMSEAGLLGYLRRKGSYVYGGIRGGGDSIIKVNAERLQRAAETVHGKGAILWNSVR